MSTRLIFHCAVEVIDYSTSQSDYNRSCPTNEYIQSYCWIYHITTIHYIIVYQRVDHSVTHWLGFPSRYIPAIKTGWRQTGQPLLYTYSCMHIRTVRYMYIHICNCTYSYIYVRTIIYMCLQLYICTYSCIYICMYRYIYVHSAIYIHVYITGIYICTYSYV